MVGGLGPPSEPPKSGSALPALLNIVKYDTIFHTVELTVCQHVCFQTMNILIVNQSIIDLCASFFTLLTAVVVVDGTRMSRDSSYDQFVCRVWLTRTPLWIALFASTYGILLMSLERYVAVIHHVWYNNNVSTMSIVFHILTLMLCLERVYCLKTVL